MRKYIVHSSRVTSGNVLHLILRPKHPKSAIDFMPGQYAAISYRTYGRPSPVRSFSIVSHPGNGQELEFAIRLKGKFTHSLAALPKGSTVSVRGPFGSFAIDEHYDRNVVMIAGGIGITPFMSMIRASTAEQRPNRLFLLYSNPTQADIPFQDELQWHAQQNDAFRYISFVTRGEPVRQPGQQTIKGRITEKHLQQLTAGKFNNCTFFICGPRQFIKTYHDILHRNGTSPDRIVTESFAASSSASAIIFPKDRPTRLTYSLTAAALVLAIAFIGLLDLARFVPRYASTEARIVAERRQSVSKITQPATTPAAQTPTTAQTQVAPTRTTPTPAAAPTTATATTPTQTTTTPQPTTPAPASTPQPTVTYQAPITTTS